MTTDPISDMFGDHQRQPQAQERGPAGRPQEAKSPRCSKDEGYIVDYKVLPTASRASCRVFLKYLPNKTHVLRGVKRVSRPGLVGTRGYEERPKLRGGLGMSIVSTSKGR